MSNTLAISERDARRLAISSQHLAGPLPSADRESLWRVLSALRCLQLDPIDVVARSHLLVLRSRLGGFDPGVVDELLWQERSLFEYWAHAASIVLAEDYPIHQFLMRRWPTGSSAEGRRVRDWLAANEPLRKHVLDRLAEGVPLRSGAIDWEADEPWQSSGWTSGRSVERMLDFLLLQGEVRVAGRKGRARLWGLSEWPELEELGEREAVSRAAEHALRALGVARQGDIEDHFTRFRYPGLPAVLEDLERVGKVRRVLLGTDECYLHVDSLPLLERIQAGEWEGRTTLLSPFDNLICHRARTERLWGFVFRTEMYVPKAKRQYGYYLMPILHGDQLVGRIAPRLDRRAGVLNVEGVYIERPVPVEVVKEAIAELGTFVGARDIRYTGPVPW